MIINSPTAKAKNYYTYSASGVKLRTEQRYDPNYTVTPSNATNPANDGLADYMNRDYTGNIIYETAKNGSAITNRTRILVDGGYIEGGAYCYYLTDHLGNNRVVANASGTVIQRNHYYPFGMSFADTPLAEQGKQPYKYNGKELDQMHGLNMYDYSARHLALDVPRFTSIDPKAELYYSWSPYVYVANNPLKFIDPTGMIKLLAITMGYESKYRGQMLSSNQKGVEHHEVNKGVGDLVSILKTATSSDPEGIGFISLWSYGSANGVFGEDFKNNNIYTSALSELKTAIEKGEVVFHENAIIYLGACNAGTREFASTLAQITGARVIAANDKVTPITENANEMVYSTGFPKKNSFYEFSMYDNPKKIGGRTDVIEWLDKAKRATSSNIEPISAQQTWNEVMSFIQNAMSVNSNIKLIIQ